MARMVTVKQNDKMWTKEEELQIIREFLEGLQSNSYLKSILEGIEGYVESQIRSDIGLPIVLELNSAMTKGMDAEKEVRKLTEELAITKETLEIRDRKVTELEARCDELRNNWYKADDEWRKQAEKARVLEAQAQQQAEEMIRLKARLFDYIEKERGAV